jgi:hypothetical protein
MSMDLHRFDLITGLDVVQKRRAQNGKQDHILDRSFLMDDDDGE